MLQLGWVCIDLCVSIGFVSNGFVSNGFVPNGFVSIGFVSIGFKSNGFISTGFVANIAPNAPRQQVPPQREKERAMNRIRHCLCAAALLLTYPLLAPAQAQVPPPPPDYGQHPAYLHALTDLHDARWYIENRPEGLPLEERERHAIAEIDRAIDLVQRAAYYDGKNVYEHPRADAYPDARGRLRRASELLRKAREDVAQNEENLQVRDIQVHAVERIDESIRLAESVMVDRERYGDHDHDRDHDGDRDHDRDRGYDRR